MLTAELSDRIAATRDGGKLAFGIYLIPGYPDWESSIAAVREAGRAGVTFVEFPVLGEAGWSGRTGPVIARALTAVADDLRDGSPRFDEWLASIGSGVGIVYGGAWPRPDRWAAPTAALRSSDALLFEDDPPDWVDYAERARSRDVPLVCAVSGSEPECSPDDVQRLNAGGGFVYVSLGSRTGERGASREAMSRKVEAVREVRPDLPVCCAFGIRSPADVREVAGATGCEGVIVGTAALEVLGDGTRPFAGWLGAMMEAAAG